MDLLSNSLNDFGFELFRTVYSSKSQVDENVIISSFSVAIAMLMTLGGARNETSSELIRSLFRSGKENSVSLHESVRSLIRSINVKEDENNRIVVANKMILNSVGVHDQFRELISNVYESSVDTVRSESSVNQLTEETNRWISELTEGRIKSIVDEETLKETSIALINAVYFKMQWLIGFNEAETRDKEFRVSAQKTKELPMMRLTRTKLPYFYSDLLKSHLLSLPYKGGRHSFNIVFPDDETDFLVFDDEKSLIRNLKYESLVGEMSKLSEQKVNVRIPKFTQEKKIKLAETLQRLGIRSAFDSSNANFTGISDERLFIRDVLQYAFIDVNEKGTEAAAATVVQIQKRSIEITPEVILNRPFIYYISDKTSNTIIFLGTFNGETPSESIKNNERTEL